MHDKDGMTALVRVLALVAGLRASGTTLAQRLDEIATTYGVTLTSQLSVRVDDLSEISDAMARLRAQPPGTLVDEHVEVSDLSAGSHDLPPTDAVLLEGPTVRVVVRPSGTEPKLKAYLEARVPLAQTEGLEDDRRRASEKLTRLRQEMKDALGLA